MMERVFLNLVAMAGGFTRRASEVQEQEGDADPSSDVNQKGGGAPSRGGAIETTTNTTRLDLD